MTEPVLTPATEPAPPTTTRLRGPGAFRVLIVGLSSIAIAIAAAVAISGAPAPALSPASAVGPGPADADGFIGLAAATQTEQAGRPGEPGMRGGGPGGQLHAITLTAKNGSSLSLKTEDGWTRTITVDGDTTYTKAGAAITLNDLAVGDTIAFRQAKQSDGSFKITEVRVILPRVSGQVTAVTDTSITLKLRDGTSKTIAVNGSTRYASGPNAATKADVKVDGYISAEGTTSGDTFTALNVQVMGAQGAPNGRGGPNGQGGPGGMRGHGGMPGMGGQNPGQKPGASAAPNASGTPG